MASSARGGQVRFELPLRLASVANLREHWASKAKRARAHRMALAAAWRSAKARGATCTLPALVRLTRVAPRALDDDNLQAAFKALRDQVAAELGVDDRSPLVVWRYAQERGKPRQHAVWVEVSS